ncbi:MAG: tripartite tricarboxylate transporter substrate binding protein [Roseomonas sp.]|nr:tripartite tricarboxylate transporter substrate binding protein [Roseomonas sp.]
MLKRRDLALAALLAAPAISARAQGAPIRMVIPFAPGGATDVIGRILAPGMQEALGGTPVVVENRGGAAGLLGAEAVLGAPPDGQTITLFTITNAVLNAGMVKNARQDPRNGFAPVSQVISMPMVLTVGKHVPAQNLQEFIALMRARPGRLTYGSAGAGGINHLGSHLLNMRTNTEALHVPYRGAGLVFTDMIAGNVDFLTEGIASQQQHVRAGSIRALAVLSRERSPLLPDVPTAIEQGLPDFEIMNFMGIFVHKATAPAQVARLEAATRAAVANPAIAQRLIEAGTDPVGSSAADFNAFWQAQLALWLPVVEASGVKLD